MKLLVIELGSLVNFTNHQSTFKTISESIGSAIEVYVNNAELKFLLLKLIVK
jgi:hypothetical protein